MRYITIAISLLILLLAIPAQAQTVTAAQKAEIEKAVKEQVTRLYSAYDSLNAEAANKMWSRDKIFGNLLATGLEADLEAMLKRGKTNMANRVLNKNEVLEITVHVLSPEMVFVSSKSHLRIELKNGNINNYNDAIASIWILESGIWKMIFRAERSAAIQ